MKLITPVHLFETGDAVANLHAGLLFLVLGQSLTPDDRRMILGRARARRESPSPVVRDADLPSR